MFGVMTLENIGPDGEKGENKVYEGDVLSIPCSAIVLVSTQSNPAPALA